MLYKLKPAVGFLCKFSGSNHVSGTHAITYVGKHGLTAGPYSVSTSNSNNFTYIIYGLRHPTTNEILTKRSDIKRYYPEVFL